MEKAMTDTDVRIEVREMGPDLHALDLARRAVLNHPALGQALAAGQVRSNTRVLSLRPVWTDDKSKAGDGSSAAEYEAVVYDYAAERSVVAPGQKPRHGSERNYLWRPTLPSRCLSAMCPMPTNSSRVL